MRKGFTLNELLVAMAIIGLLLILAVPRIYTNIDKRTKVAALQRVNMVLDNAVGTLMMNQMAKSIKMTPLFEENDPLEDPYNMETAIGSFFNTYLDVKRDCGLTVSDCLAPAYKNLQGDDVTIPEDADADAYCTIISSGAAICIAPAYEDSSTPKKLYPAKIWVDTNAKRRPNVAGRDFFRFIVYDNGDISDAISENGIDATVDPYFGNEVQPSACIESTLGGGCLTRIIRAEWIMEY